MAAMLIPIITSLLSSESSSDKGTYQKPFIDWNALVSSYDDGLELTDEEREKRKKLWEGYA